MPCLKQDIQMHNGPAMKIFNADCCASPSLRLLDVYFQQHQKTDDLELNRDSSSGVIQQQLENKWAI
jgi:hypothetical protein